MRLRKEKVPRLAQLFPCRLGAPLLLVVLFPMSLWAQSTPITFNVIHRTFLIKWETSTETSTGTAFAIDHSSKQYLVTARHVVKEIKSGNVIKLFHEEKWKNLTVNVVGIGKGKDMDVAVLACPIRLAPPLPLVASASGIDYGQPVAFLGYPFGWDGGGEQINRGIPMPFVKAGIVSALVSGDVTKVYLDAHGNKGFSGGPVVFAHMGQSGEELRVAGVISHYPPTDQPELRSTWQPLVDSKGNPFLNPDGEPIGYIIENPGIVVAIGIHHAVELIDANPIGFQLPADKDDQ